MELDRSWNRILLVLVGALIAFVAVYSLHSSVAYAADEPNAWMSEKLPFEEVKGGKVCEDKLKRALYLLRTKSRDDYSLVTEQIKVVACGKYWGASIMATNTLPIVHIGQAWMAENDTEFAAMLVHEACHGKQYQAYREGKEPLPYGPQRDREEECTLRYEYNTLVRLGAPESHLQWVRDEKMKLEWWNTPHW